jgi:hypothetical protein
VCDAHRYLSPARCYLSPRSSRVFRERERPGQHWPSLMTTTLGTRSGDNNLWELVTPTAGRPRQMPRSPGISGDIYRWASHREKRDGGLQGRRLLQIRWSGRSWSAPARRPALAAAAMAPRPLHAVIKFAGCCAQARAPSTSGAATVSAVRVPAHRSSRSVHASRWVLITRPKRSALVPALA